jgi:hypothetical protein
MRLRLSHATELIARSTPDASAASREIGRDERRRPLGAVRDVRDRV